MKFVSKTGRAWLFKELSGNLLKILCLKGISDRFVRKLVVDGAGLHTNQHSYKTGKSTESALLGRCTLREIGVLSDLIFDIQFNFSYS